MKTFSNGTIKNSILFASITVLLTIASPSAFADTPSGFASPDPLATGVPTTVTIERGGGSPHGSSQGIFVYDPTAVANQIDDGSGQCNNPVASSGDYWILLTTGGSVINYWIPNVIGAQVSVPFGTGAQVVITPAVGAKVGTGIPPANGAAFGQTTPLAANWHKVTNYGVMTFPVTVIGGSSQSDNTNAVGQWQFVSCGKEGATFLNDYQAEANFNVVLPVGGEIIPINTAALMIAGLTSSGIWMIPTLGVMAGIGVTLYKIRRTN
jgi:hypothetical protein